MQILSLKIFLAFSFLNYIVCENTTVVLTRTLDAEFLPSQCWQPAKQEPVLSLILDNKAGNDSSTKSNDSSSWTPPPSTPSNITEVIANNDVRAYYFYLSDPNLNIETKLECEASELDAEKNVLVIRHKYVFVDSNGNQVEVVSEENETKGELERIETRKKEPKIPRELLMSLISGKVKYRMKNGSN